MTQYTPKASTTFVVLIYLHYLAIQVPSLDILKQGDNLNSSSQLVSANRIFTLGFYTDEVEDTVNSYLAIRYLNDSAPVWIGNREQPIPKNRPRFLTIGGRGELMIRYDGGETVELYGGGSRQNATATATLLDTGNFVARSSSGEVLWQSFDHPTDTLLPGMKLGLNRRTGRNLSLSSSVGFYNPAPGAFTLEWDPIAGVLLVKRRGVVYWRSNELRDYYDEYLGRWKKFHNLNFNLGASFYYSYNSTDVTSNGGEPTLEPSIRLRFDGSVSLRSRNMEILWASPCYLYNGEDLPEGCELLEQPKCRNHRETFGLRSGDFQVDGKPVMPIHDSNSSLSPSDCWDSCWNDCECVAYMCGDGITGCVYWRGKNLKFVQSLDGSAARKYVLDSAASAKEKKKHIQIILAVVAATVLLISATAIFVKRKQGVMEEELHGLLTLEGYTESYELENRESICHDLEHFTYASIVCATSNFSSDNKLGEGGFVPVYKIKPLTVSVDQHYQKKRDLYMMGYPYTCNVCSFFKGKTAEGQDIAVKLLSRQSGQGLLEFKTELVLLSKLQHVNLVKVLGYCIHGNDKMIIYEYMHNKSLDFSLFNPSEREHLDWPKRFNIIEGIAQGLLYLHKYSCLRIIHRGLKPNNILLDKNMNPKISDFGLARIFKQNASEANTNSGYMAPEYAMQGIFSVKSDIYSFGVLVLEIVSGRKNNSFRNIKGPLNLVEYAWELWGKDSATELMDPTLRDCTVDQPLRCIHIGLLCVENHAVDRPTSEDVVSMLRNEKTTLPMPKCPSFITTNNVVEELQKSSSEKISANEITLSEIQGR